MDARAGTWLSEASAAARLDSVGLVQRVSARRLGLHSACGRHDRDRHFPRDRIVCRMARWRETCGGAVPALPGPVLQFSRIEMGPELDPDPALGARHVGDAARAEYAP